METTVNILINHILVGLVAENHGMNQVVHYNNIMDH